MGDWFNMKPFNQLWEGTWRVTCTRWSSEERQCRIARNSQEFWQIWMGILKSFNHRISNGHTPGCEIMMMTYTESKYRTKFVFSLTYKTLSYLGEDHIITTEISNDTMSWFLLHQTSQFEGNMVVRTLHCHKSPTNIVSVPRWRHLPLFTVPAL